MNTVRRSILVLTLALLVYPVWADAGEADPPANLSLEKTGRALVISATNLPDGLDSVEVRIRSDRNASISKFSDRSPDAPAGTDDRAESWEAWYPVVDVVLEPGMEGLASFEHSGEGSYSINGAYHPEKHAVRDEAIFPMDKLEFWENLLYVEPAPDITLTDFYLRKRLPTSKDALRHVVELLTPSWGGRVALHAAGSGEELAAAEVAGEVAAEETPLARLQGEGLSAKRLTTALEGTVEYTLRSQNKNPLSPTYGGVFLFYDLSARTYRRTTWIFSMGPSIKLLLDAAAVPGVTEKYAPEELRTVAHQIGEATLRVQEKDPSHPAYGIAVSRWRVDPSGFDIGHGYEKYYNLADAFFLAGWGWVPLYEQTGDKQFLEAAELQAEAAERLLNEFGIPPMDYMEKEGVWKNYSIGEQGFGMEGLAELALATDKERHFEIGRRYIEQMVDKFQREDGRWNQKWNKDRQEASGPSSNPRAQGWGMEGLLAAYRMTKEEKYLGHAKDMADYFMRTQHPTGYWKTHFDRPVEEVGISEKGTALWSLLLYRLYGYTGNEEHLEAARKALEWLLDNQRSVPGEAYGSVVDHGSEAGIVFREWFDLSTNYSAAFFGLAILEELKLKRKG